MAKKFLLMFVFLLIVGIVIVYTQKAFSIESQKVIIKGIERSYYVFLPKNYNPKKTYPALLVFHGGGGNAKSILNATGFKDYLNEYQFILIAPNGSGRFDKETLLTWNAGNCCGYAFNTNVDEVSFINEVIERTAKSYNVDRKRIYLTGMSNGAMVTYKLACELSAKIAGIAPVAGSMNYEPCNAKKPIPVILFNGTDDEHVLYNGGVPVKSADKRTRVDKPVSYAVNFWVKNNKCNTNSLNEKTGNIIIDKYTHCENNADVTLYTVVGGKHAWPGGQKGSQRGDEPTKEINATKIILDKFIKD